MEFDPKGLRLLDSQGLYNNTALLFSEQNPKVTKIAVIDGTDLSADFLAKQEIAGSIIKQIDLTLDYLSLYNPKRVVFKGTAQREEFESYPTKAIREAIINAYAHRDYFLTADIKVEVYKDRMEIFSAGSLPDGLSIEDIKEGISALRNPNIVHVLDKMDYIENYATGIRRILTSYQGFDKPPQFIVTPNQLKVILYNRHYHNSAIADGMNELNTVIGDKTNGLDDNDLKLLSFLNQNKDSSRAEIQQHMQEGKNQTLQRLAKLIKLDILIKTGNARSTIYSLKK